jgi:predicted ATP-binding protein involved in virulence
MKITKVTLQNFRGIGSLELDFPIDQNIIALVGVNGVGKSSILDAITTALHAGLFSRNYIAIRNELTDKNSLEALHSKTILNLISGSYNSSLSLVMNRKVFFRDSDIKITQQKFSCRIILSEMDRKYEFNVSKVVGKVEIANETSNQESPRTRFNGLIIYYSSGRKIQEISPEYYSRWINDSDVSCDDESSDFENFFAWFKELEDIENEERLETSTYRSISLESVRKAVYSILGKGFSRLRVKRATNDLIINKDGIDIPIACLSDGEKSLIALVSDIARKLATTYSAIETLLEGEGIILIDEIELHMHPTWQRMIIPRLTKTFPNCQFIITTHSPQVLSHVQPESIYLLKKVGEDIVVTKPQYSYGRDSNRILEDLMDETERPAEIQDQLGELFSLIHQGHLSEAQQLVEQLSETIGASEPELGKAEVMIKRREIIGR